MLKDLDLQKPPARDTLPELPKGSRTMWEEIEANFDAAERLRDSTEYDESIPLNQKSQVMSTITAILAQRIKMKQEVHNLENLIGIENALMTAVKTLPDSAQDVFFSNYERILP